MTDKNKIAIEKSDIVAIKVSNKTQRKSCGNGNAGLFGDVYGRSTCDGQPVMQGVSLFSRFGNSYGAGIFVSSNFTDITDPVALQPLFFSSKNCKYGSGWDQIWDECNDEQKQHLLLYLPLKGTNY